VKSCRIAVSGKGGTGKTTTSALLVRSLIEAGGGPILAVDADPNANLHEALGIEIRETLGSMREEAFTKSIPPGMSRSEYIRYRFRQVLVEAEGYDLIAMGMPEGTGCYCFANNLLSEAMQLLQDEYRYVVIDTEAGMEHISRGTVGIPDLLLIVSDPGARGLRTAARIHDIAREIGFTDEQQYLVFNRYRTGTADVPTGLLRTIARIPDDPAVEAADLAAKPIVSIPAESPALREVRQLAGAITTICREKKKS